MYLQAPLLQVSALASLTAPQLNIVPPTMSAELDMQYLFGGPEPWNTTRIMWNAVDDRVRGGSSQSYLDVFEDDQRQLDGQSAKFYGVLDTTTLGGAGFASRSTKTVSQSESSEQSTELLWDLSAYDGLCLMVYAADGKMYTLTLKDELPDSKRDDGRERSGISWEADFRIPAGSTGRDTRLVTSDQRATESTGFLVKIPWSQFKATYRGRDAPDAKPLQTKNILRFSLMMRSFFEKQSGPFELIVDYLAAYRSAE